MIVKSGLRPPDEKANATPGGFKPTVRLYYQLCHSYRAIDGFRAKLLGFLPVATGMGIFFLADNLKASKKLPWKRKA